MQINDEQCRRCQEGGLRSQQPVVGAAVEAPRTLIELLSVVADVTPIGSEGARVLRGPADIEQRIPRTPRLAVLTLGEHDQRGDACGREPFAGMHDGTAERLTLAVSHQPSAVSPDGRWLMARLAWPESVGMKPPASTATIQIERVIDTNKYCRGPRQPPLAGRARAAAPRWAP